MNFMPKNEKLVVLEWEGPFRVWYDKDQNPICKEMENCSALKDFDNRDGLYAIIGDHHVHGLRCLLYIGKGRCNARLGGHLDSWLRREWNIEIYIAVPEDRHFLDDLEKLLIYSHSPIYCSKSVSGMPMLSQNLRIWNVGTCNRILGEVSSCHPWYYHR